MLSRLPTAVILLGSFLTAASGEEVSDDLCLLPSGNFPHPNNCASFIRCNNGVAEVKTCPSGLLFNPFLITCDFSLTKSCSTEDDFQQSIALVETNDLGCPEDGPNIFPIPSSCPEYYLCINETAYRAQCPGDLLMNSDKMTCDFPDDTSCDITSTSDIFPQNTRMIATIETRSFEPDPENNIGTTSMSTEATPEEISFTKSNILSTENIEYTTKSVETEDEKNVDKEYSTSVSVTEFTTNKSPTVITVSTEQTKEGTDDIFETTNDLNPTKLITSLRPSVESETTEYTSTMNDRATSSDTANPFSDITTPDYFTSETFANISQTLDESGTTVESTEIKNNSLIENLKTSGTSSMTEAGTTSNFDEMGSSIAHTTSSTENSGMTLSSSQTTEEYLNVKTTSETTASNTEEKFTESTSEFNSKKDTLDTMLTENDRSASITELSSSLSDEYLTNTILDSSTSDSVSSQHISTVAETSENKYVSDEEITTYSETSEFTTESITSGHERTNEHTEEFEITEGVISPDTPTIATLMSSVPSTGSSTEELQTTPIRTTSEIQPTKQGTKPTEITEENFSIFNSESYGTEEIYTSVSEENNVTIGIKSTESNENKTEPQDTTSASTSRGISSTINEEVSIENVSTPEPTDGSSSDFTFKSTEQSTLTTSSIKMPLSSTANTLLTITTIDDGNWPKELSTVSDSYATGSASISEKFIDVTSGTFTDKENTTGKSVFTESQTDSASENDVHTEFFTLDKTKSTIKEEITTLEPTKISSAVSGITDVSSIETVTEVYTSKSSPGASTTLESKLTEISLEYTSTPYSSLENKLETLSTEMTTTQKDFTPKSSSQIHSEATSKSSDQTTIAIYDNTNPTSEGSKSNELTDLPSTLETTNEYENVTENISVPFKYTTTEVQPSENPSLMTSEIHTVTASKWRNITVDLDEPSSVQTSSDHTFDISTRITGKEDIMVITPSTPDDAKQTYTPLSSPQTTAEVEDITTTETSTATTSKIQSPVFPEIFTETTSSYNKTTDMNYNISETSTFSLPPSTGASTSEITLKITSAATREDITTKMSANFETSQNTEMLFTDAISTTYTFSPEIATGTQENIRNETTFSTETSETIQETSTDLTVSTITGTSTFSPSSKETSESSLLTSKTNSYISNTSEIATSELYDNVTKDDQTFTENPSTSDITTTYLKKITNSSEMTTKGIKVSPTNLEETSTDASSSYISTTESTTKLNEEITTERPPSEISETDIPYTDLPFTLSKTSVTSNMFETSSTDKSGKENMLSTEIVPETTSGTSRVNGNFTTDTSNIDEISSTLSTTDTTFSKTSDTHEDTTTEYISSTSGPQVTDIITETTAIPKNVFTVLSTATILSSKVTENPSIATGISDFTETSGNHKLTSDTYEISSESSSQVSITRVHENISTENPGFSKTMETLEESTYSSKMTTTVSNIDHTYTPETSRTDSFSTNLPTRFTKRSSLPDDVTETSKTESSSVAKELSSIVITESPSEVSDMHDNKTSQTSEIVLSTHILSTTSDHTTNTNEDSSYTVDNSSEEEHSHDITTVSPRITLIPEVTSEVSTLSGTEITINGTDSKNETETQSTVDRNTATFKYSTIVSKISSPATSDTSHETSDTTSETSDGKIVTGMTTISDVSIENERTSKPNVKVHTNSMGETVSTMSNLDPTREPRLDTSSLSTDSTTINNICIKATGFYPNPDDCGTFYLCSKGVPELSYCTENFHFNPVRKMCEEPCKAMCDKNADCPTSTTEDNYMSTTKQQPESTSAITQTQQSSTFDLDTTEDNGMTSSIATSEATDITNIFTTPFDATSQAETELSKFVTDSITKSSDITDPTSEVTQTPQYTTSERFTTDKLIRTTIDFRSTPSTSSVTLDISTLDTKVPASASTTEFESTSAEVSTFSRGGLSSTTVPQTVDTSSEDQSSSLTTRSITEDKTSPEDYISTDSVTSTFISDDSLSTSETTDTECENNEDCPSTEDPKISTHIPFGICRRSDFIPLHRCDKFINCTTAIPKLKKCAKGLHFNPTSRVCDWPYKAGCGRIAEPLYKPDDSFTCPCRSCLIPSSENCQEYYLCLGFTAYQMKCSNNLLFDTIKNTCTYAYEVDCQIHTTVSTASTRLTTTTKRSSTTKSTTLKSTTQRTTLSTSKTTTSTSKPKIFVCPTSNGLFKHPENCQRFIQCSNGRPYTMSCPASLHFNEEKQICDYPCNAKCDPSLRCGVTSEAPSDTRCSCHNCKLPSTSTCTKYIECINGIPRSVNCPRGQTFDAKRSICDWAHRVNCQHSERCPRSNGLFAHKDDCHKFVHCSNGIPYIKNCPYKLEFDPSKERCEWPSGRCNPSVSGKVPDVFKTEEQRADWKCPQTFGYFAAEQCNKFYYCSLGVPSLKECSNSLLYNPKIQNCDWKNHVRCDSHRHNGPKKCRVYDHHVTCPKSRVLLPHVRCSMYYDCSSGAACAKRCPAGLYFNKTSGLCDQPANVECFTPNQKQYSLKDFGLSCATGDKRKMVDPADKTCFYHCQHGKVISGCCSRGRIYNEHRDRCERISRYRIPDVSKFASGSWETSSDSSDSSSDNSDSSD